GPATLQHPDHAGMRDTRTDLQTQAAQMLSDDFGGALFAVAELGVRVEVASPLDHFRLNRSDLAVPRRARYLCMHGCACTKNGDGPEHAGENFAALQRVFAEFEGHVRGVYSGASLPQRRAE